jgi:hypothetical protein
MTSDTMLIVYMKEAFINEFEDPEQNNQPGEEIPETGTSAIQGLDEVYPFDTATYTIEGYEGGI